MPLTPSATNSDYMSRWHVTPANPSVPPTPRPSQALRAETLGTLQPARCVLAGKNPEDVVRRYMQKVKNPPDEVSPQRRVLAWADRGPSP